MSLSTRPNDPAILRTKIERYLDSISSLTFNTIKTKLNIHAVHNSNYLQLKLTFTLSHASMVKIQYSHKHSKLVKTIFIVCIP